MICLQNILMPSMVPIPIIASATLCLLVGQVTSQPCLYNLTIGNGGLPVIVTQSSPVCLICYNTTYTQWNIGASSYSGIPGAPYVLYVPTPTTTFSASPTAYCYYSAMSLLSSVVHIAVPVVPQVITYVNESNTLNLDCAKVVTVSIGAIFFMGQSWLDPNGNTISTFPIVPFLSIPSINRTAAGNYTCATMLILNANGLSSVNAITNVVVYYPPTIVSPQPTVYIIQGSDAQLRCTFDGLPVPTITWTSPSGSVIMSQSRFLIQSNTTSTSITISSVVGERDSGIYTCTASNFRGVSFSTVLLIMQVPPDPPLNAAAMNVDNSSISLSWTNAFDGYSPLVSIIISYEVDRYPHEGTQTQNFPAGTSAKLVGLHPFSNYTIHIRLVNAVELVSKATNITVATSTLSPTAPTITSLVTASSTQLTVTWTPPFINSSTTAPVTSWTIVYTCSSSWSTDCPYGTITSIPPSSFSFSINGLMKGSNYTVIVGGVNNGGTGSFSQSATTQTAVTEGAAVSCEAVTTVSSITAFIVAFILGSATTGFTVYICQEKHHSKQKLSNPPAIGFQSVTERETEAKVDENVAYSMQSVQDNKNSTIYEEC